jgi:hypothetical protein
VRSSSVAGRTSATALIGFALVVALAPIANADPQDTADPAVPAPVGPAVPAVAGVTSDNADPAAVQACGQFADVLEGTSSYYGDFADALETWDHIDYNDPATSASNETARTALRQGAGATMSAANTPGLSPDIADPMRSWSWGATKLLVKMGVRGGRETLNTTADQMNNDATNVQQACAAAGTHA